MFAFCILFVSRTFTNDLYKSNHIIVSKRFRLFYTKYLLFLFYTIIFTKHSHQFIYYTHIFIKIIFSLFFFYYFPPNPTNPSFLPEYTHFPFFFFLFLSLSPPVFLLFFFFFLRIFFFPLLLLQFGFYTFIIDDDFGLGLIKAGILGGESKNFGWRKW